MKQSSLICGLLLVCALAACGGRVESNNAPDLTARNKADSAKLALQEKADKLAREASIRSTQKSNEKK